MSLHVAITCGLNGAHVFASMHSEYACVYTQSVAANIVQPAKPLSGLITDGFAQVMLTFASVLGVCCVQVEEPKVEQAEAEAETPKKKAPKRKAAKMEGPAKRAKKAAPKKAAAKKA